MKIAICITTRNRPEVFARAIAMQRVYLPKQAKIFVVDDNSSTPMKKLFPTYGDEEWFYSTRQLGIPRAKNKCLAMADSWGADQIFLFDDDCWPIKRGWETPYIRSKEPHLMYQFKLPNKAKNDMRELYRDDKIVAYSHTRGAMIYVDKTVLRKVGGLDPSYGLGMYEHADWTTRIHNAGLTTHRAMDIPGSWNYLYCLDENGEVESSIPDDVRKTSVKQNGPTYLKAKNSAEYKEYR